MKLPLKTGNSWVVPTNSLNPSQSLHTVLHCRGGGAQEYKVGATILQARIKRGAGGPIGLPPLAQKWGAPH